MPSPLRLALALFLTILLTATAAPVALAQQSSRSVESPRFDVDVQVLDGGSLLVRETQQISFRGGPFQKGSRKISLRDTEGVSDVEVSEGSRRYQPGQDFPNTFSVTGPTQGSAGQTVVEWWFPPTTNQTRTFVLTYRVNRAIRFYDGGDQLRWNALASDRGYPIAQTTVTVHLPKSVSPNDWKLDAYPGQYLQGRPSPSGDTATWTAHNLPPNQGFEVRAQWPHGLIAGSPPGWQTAQDAADRQRENLAPVLTLAFGTATLVVGLGGVLWLLMSWYTRGKDVPVGAVPPELDEMPSELPPGLAGTLVDEGADVQDVIATVLDLARREVIQITEVRDDELAGSQRDFEIALLQEDTARLHPFERRVLDTFFMQGSPVRLSQLGDWFHRAIPAIQSAIYEDVAREGLFVENPERVRGRYRRLGVGLGISGIVLALVLGGAFGAYTSVAGWPGIMLALVGGGAWLISKRMPRRTAAGALEAARWRAFARHLRKVQPDAMTRVAQLRDQSALAHGDAREHAFEETLPYAVAFGIERGWVQKFATVGVPAPRWLQPPVVVIGGPGWGPGWGGGYGGGGGGGPWIGAPGPHRGPDGNSSGAPADAGGPQAWNDSAAGGLNNASGSLMDLLNRASEVLSRGGGSDWSGGGGGGGWSGGGGGGSGGGGSDFS